MRALLIDMDGTLVETETRWWQAEIEVMERHGSTWTTDDQNQAIGGPLQAVADYMAAKANSDAKKCMTKLLMRCSIHSQTILQFCNLDGQKF